MSNAYERSYDAKSEIFRESVVFSNSDVTDENVFVEKPNGKSSSNSLPHGNKLKIVNFMGSLLMTCSYKAVLVLKILHE